MDACVRAFVRSCVCACVRAYRARMIVMLYMPTSALSVDDGAVCFGSFFALF